MPVPISERDAASEDEDATDDTDSPGWDVALPAPDTAMQDAAETSHPHITK